MSHAAGVLKEFLTQRDVLFGFVLALTRDREAAEEIFQEVGLAVSEEAHRGVTVRQFSPWIHEIIRRRVAEHFRKHARRRDRELSSGKLEELVARSFGENEPDTEALRRRQDILAHCLEDLSGRKKDVIDGHYRKRQSIREIATTLSWTEGAVKVALWKARQLLSRCVEGRLRLQAEGE